MALCCWTGHLELCLGRGGVHLWDLGELGYPLESLGPEWLLGCLEWVLLRRGRRERPAGKVLWDAHCGYLGKLGGQGGYQRRRGGRGSGGRRYQGGGLLVEGRPELCVHLDLLGNGDGDTLTIAVVVVTVTNTNIVRVVVVVVGCGRHYGDLERIHFLGL